MGITYAVLANRLVELGMVPVEAVGEVLDLCGADEEPGPADIGFALVDFGVAVAVHGDDVDDLEESYRELLRETAAVSGVVVGEVVLGRDDDGAESLRFEVGGVPVVWGVEHRSEEYLDQLAVFEFIDRLEPGGDDPRRFHALDGVDVGAVYVLATPEQARALEVEFGIAYT
ncbi:hypothetical protein [Umezawaea sp. Da 62-37]|uniref:hypothetical protein n=1 Tax=Umezawaea sp. Da 62-37 TaxID=3075927 RepID=UPI0028F6D341|nr:hypothetical protein [Umezawaea sp. Da 62-37]WNV86477.1 hypothetical protein RM788_51600 [Umezawaea sp. Da 62-37]